MKLKFRAWNKDTKSMYRNVIVGGNVVFAQYSLEDDDFEPRYYTIDNSKTCFDVMPFTGINSSVGQELYLRDIIKAYRRDDHQKKDPVLSEVTWLNGCYMMFNCTYHEFYQLWLSDWEIVGNIYQNPEILKAATA